MEIFSHIHSSNCFKCGVVIVILALLILINLYIYCGDYFSISTSKRSSLNVDNALYHHTTSQMFTISKSDFQYSNPSFVVDGSVNQTHTTYVPTTYGVTHFSENTSTKENSASNISTRV